jgi:hypothetical protein
MCIGGAGLDAPAADPFIVHPGITVASTWLSGLRADTEPCTHAPIPTAPCRANRHEPHPGALRRACHTHDPDHGARVDSAGGAPCARHETSRRPHGQLRAGKARRPRHETSRRPHGQLRARKARVRRATAHRAGLFPESAGQEVAAGVLCRGSPEGTSWYREHEKQEIDSLVKIHPLRNTSL